MAAENNRKLAFSVVLLVLLIAVGALYIAMTAGSGLKHRMLKGERINLLLLGISETDYAKFAEVIKVISYEPVTGFLDIISIPRDTMVSVPYKVSWKRIQKMDEIYGRYCRSFNDPDELFMGFKSRVEEFMEGYFDIDYYVQIDYRAFTDFIDRLGGIEMEVREKMDYDDNAQNLHIHISTGTHRFNGEEALKYVRYRDKIRGDIGRQERQHRFLTVLLKKLKTPEAVVRLPSLASAVIKNVDTNLKYSDFLVIMDELRNFSIKNFRIQKVPGSPEIRWGKSYWKVDREGMRELMDVVKNSQLINMPSLAVDRKASLSTPITAEVWNATNRPNLARDLTEYLRKRNVDVVRYGNYGVCKKYTQIISRTGDLKPARAVSGLIGCRNIKTELDSSRMVDINIVIGRDFKLLWKE